jgi:glycine/D-amino acid oxidase-like deaminating enzyme
MTLDAMTVDVLIIGAGIVGCALAESCAQRGLSVTVLEKDIPAGGATAAGMGHLVVLDGNPAELALSKDGLQRWQARQSSLPGAVEYSACGTLWVARSHDEMAEAERKHAKYAAHGLTTALLGSEALHRLEPNLSPELVGALHVPNEAVIYPPVACQWLLKNALALGATLVRNAHAVAVEDDGRVGQVRLADGSVLRAKRIVIAAGCMSIDLMPSLPLVPRKGQLVITERYPRFIQHQLVELGYLQSAHSASGDTVAFNVQPRATGQILIGSSRQYDDTSSEIDWSLLSKMLSHAFGFLPGLENLQGIRSWCGFRPATPDKLPLLGRAPGCERIWLATGHEGLGITTALASAELLAAMMVDETTTLDPSPYDPGRFAAQRPLRSALHLAAAL